VFDLVLQSLPLIEPTKPAEVTEDRASDVRTLDLGQSALGFEVRAEDGVSRIIAVAALDYRSGETKEFLFHEFEIRIRKNQGWKLKRTA
jgi:hypothetical protein